MVLFCAAIKRDISYIFWVCWKILGPTKMRIIVILNFREELKEIDKPCGKRVELYV